MTLVNKYRNIIELIWTIPVSIIVLAIAYTKVVFTLQEAIGAVIAVWVVWLIMYMGIHSDGFSDWEIPILWRCPECSVVFEQTGDDIICTKCGYVIAITDTAPEKFE